MSLTNHTRHIVRYKARRHTPQKFDAELRRMVATGPSCMEPIEPPLYIGAGGTNQTDMQKAQVFGWAKRARENLEDYAKDPECYEVIPVDIVPNLLAMPHT